MTCDVPPGKYVLAVSGGVDSIVLLHLLADRPEIELVVAHFDHGIRPDSAKDAQIVEKLAQQFGLAYVSKQGELGAGASELVARDARYAFLYEVCDTYAADALITAHHQDDLVETMILNMLRGTGRRGMSPMQTSGIIRPLLHVSKKEILEYAAAHKLSWHEDSTNLDQKYRRNYVRHSVVPRLNDSKKQFVALSDQASVRNQEIDALLGELDTWVRDKNGVIIRSRMVCLPFSVGKEYMHHLLTRAAIQNINTDLLYRLVIAVKTLQPGKKIDVDNRHWLQSYGSTVEILQK